VARVLTFDDTDVADRVMEPPSFSASHVSILKKRGRPRKTQPALVQSENRHFTRSSLRLDGYRPTPVIQKVKTQKIKRAKLLVTKAVEKQPSVSVEDQEQESMQRMHTPVTPILVMQRVGYALGISPDKLTKDKLEAGPSSPDDVSHND
jgi:hypothetical protein